jgi:hypothetical protein
MESRQARWRRENPERYKEQQQRWVEENRDRLREYQREWRKRQRAANPEAIRAKDRARYAADQPRIRARMQKLFDANREANLLAIRAGDLRRKHGITVAEYERLLASQNGVCAVCRQPSRARNRPNLYVDHNHGTGAIRGLLCSNCNLLLGHADDDPQRLEAAARYLRQTVG